jgi:AraC family transcriptional regulator
MEKSPGNRPHIIQLTSKKMVGVRMTMSLADNRTGDLWRSFMTRRKEILNTIGTDLYSLQIYTPPFDIKKFGATMPFVKWALTEVADHDNMPTGFEQFVLEGGLYAVFIHKGTPADFAPTIDLIFNQWLPTSDYMLDDRPHFEILGEKYLRDHPLSEEEIWIPIKKR